MERLIYTDTDLKDVGYLDGFSLDLENGREDDFEIKLSINQFSKLSVGCLIYCEEKPQYGGRVEEFIPNTAESTVTFAGSTWRGILKKKILLKNVSYAADSSLSDIVQHTLDLSDFNSLFAPVENLSTIGKAAQIGLYLSPLAALENILSFVNCRPSFTYDPNKKRILIGTSAVVDYSSQEYDSDQISMELSVNKMPVNHIVAVAKSGSVHHLYLHYDGTYSTTQEIKGAAEVMKLINVSSDDSAEISQAMLEAMDEAQISASASALSVNSISAEIGDIVGSYEQKSKTFVTSKITSKVLKMTYKSFIINFETGEF